MSELPNAGDLSPPDATGSRAWLRRWILPIGFALLVAAGLAAFFMLYRGSTENADHTFVSPYLNVRPEVAYVGQERCAACHIAEAESYQAHPMGNSIGRVADYHAIENYDVKNTFQAVGYEYRVRKAGPKLFQTEKKFARDGKLIFDKEVEVEFSVGTGNSGRAYIANRQGFLTLAPITWYPRKKTWDLSPGYQKTADHPHFERPVVKACIYCHANEVEMIPPATNRFKEPVALHPIGCERCHGPGELHVRWQEEGTGPGQEYSIVNPARLSPVLRDAVCEQCHLHPEFTVSPLGRDMLDYRPGLPLHLFQALFVLAPEMRVENAFGSRVEEMHASACHQQSAGKFACISCHDPHKKPLADERVAFFRDRCLKCHGAEARLCSEPLAARMRHSKEDDCAGCHMPRNPTDFPHVSQTNHRVLRPGKALKPDLNKPRGNFPLVRFRQDVLKPGEGERELAIAIVDHTKFHPLPAQIISYVQSTLRPQVQNHPEDIEARRALGLSQVMSNEPRAALASFESILDKAPNHELALVNAAIQSGLLGMDRDSLSYWDRALKVNPYSSQYYLKLGILNLQRKSWLESEQAAHRALELNPALVAARKLLVLVYLEQRHKAQALAAWQAFAAFEPPEKDALRVRVDRLP